MANKEEAQQQTESSRGLSKTREGLVVSNKMDKTCVVAIKTRKKHPQYGKFIERTNKYMAHDEENTCQVGDRVLIVETRPLSKNKRWRVRSVVERTV